MANPEHLAILKQGMITWNDWRAKNPDIRPDLRNCNLSIELFRHAKLPKIEFTRTGRIRKAAYKAIWNSQDLRNLDLHKTDLREALLDGINLERADLAYADLENADMTNVNLTKADLHRADLTRVVAMNANFTQANLEEASMSGAAFLDSNFRGANLSKGNLQSADLTRANLRCANLKRADLRSSILVQTNFEGADLTECRVFGVSVWKLRLLGAKQLNLNISSSGEPKITVDNLEVAQFIHLLLNNKKIRGVIDTIARKVVLILGRFTPERKAVLDAIREELRKRDYLPVLFDFDKPATRDITETMRTLAHLSRFIIADISDPSSIPLELQAVVPDLAVPVQPLLLSGQREFSMFDDLRKKYHWVLATHQYTDINDLLASLGDKVIAPAEQMAKELEKR
jgi:uncharacterized protein YjbI with pentapeptide repeats